MFDYAEQIRDFLKLNFSPSSPDVANFKVTSNELLNYLFNTFPNGCINDYELNEILLKLGYERFAYINEVIHNASNEKERITKNMIFGWCMFSQLLDFNTKK